MRTFKKIISLTLVAATLLSVASCARKIKKIDEEDFKDALSEYINWEEDRDYTVEENYEYETENRNPNVIEYGDPIVFDLDCYLFGSAYTVEGTYAEIQYLIFESPEDADYYFYNCRYAAAEIKTELEKSYNKGSDGYIIYKDKKDDFQAYYYAEDMIIIIFSSDEDAIKSIRKILKDYDYPY